MIEEKVFTTDTVFDCVLMGVVDIDDVDVTVLDPVSLEEIVGKLDDE